MPPHHAAACCQTVTEIITASHRKQATLHWANHSGSRFTFAAIVEIYLTPSPAGDDEINDVIAIGVANLMSLLVKARLHVKRERKRERKRVSCSSVDRGFEAVSRKYQAREGERGRTNGAERT